LNNKISDKDKKDWEEFVSKKEKLLNKDVTQYSKKNYKIKEIDLHGYTLDKANQEIKNFILSCFNEGIRNLRVVTGKGLHSQNDKDPYISKDLGILKYSVPEYIKNDNELMNIISNFQQARIEEGGEGAFYIFLKKK
tara:strand:- start:1254 stop:1664 length:411 start_codon:yes stop_codon:yes gene_type:complete